MKRYHHQHTLLIGLFLFIGLARAEAAADSTDWPTGRGPMQNGKSPLVGIRKDWTGGLKKVWAVKDLCVGNLKLNSAISSPVVAQGIVVVMGRGDDKDLLFGFDAEKGTALWLKEYASKADKPWGDLGCGARAAPVIDGNFVYTLGAYGHLACWDLKTGAQKWLLNARDESKTNIPYWGVCGSPVVYGNNILVKVGGYEQGPNAPLVMAFDKATGKLTWKSADAPGSWAPLAILNLDGKDQLLAWHSKGLVGLDPASGKQFWNIPWNTAYDCHATIPAVEGSTLFMSSGYDTGCQAFEMKGDKPTALWPQSKAVSSCTSDPLIQQGIVYSFTGNGQQGALKCLDLKTGAEKWKTADFGNGSAVLMDGCLLCFGYGGKLGLVEAKPDAYKKLAELQVYAIKGSPSYSTPAVAKHLVYLRYQGELICYDLKN